MKQLLKKILGERLLFKYRQYKHRDDPELIAELHKRISFYSLFINAGDLCFDIGANVGNRIEPLLKIGAKVVAIEPQESCIKILKMKFGKKIELVTLGLGATEGFGEFHVSNESTISSFSNEWIDAVKQNRFKGYKWENAIEVKLTTIDKLIKKYGTPDFIKIDVEGYELEVLKGLSEKIKMISFEYTVPEQLNKISECIFQISRNSTRIQCNYSIGEKMKFALSQWLPIKDMLNLITSPTFLETEFGDIYIRSY